MKKIIILGAGLSGIYLKSKLSESIVIEKSRGIGGRIATRRLNNNSIDHGAQYLPRHHELSLWFKTFNIDLNENEYGIYHNQGLTNLLKPHHHNNIILNTKITHLGQTSHGWNCQTEDDQSFSSHILILTFPIPQVIEALKKSGLNSSYDKMLGSIKYEKCIEALFISHAHHTITHDPDHQFYHMREKNISNGALIRLSSKLSEQLFELDDETIKNYFYSKFDFLKNQTLELKKWRFSQCINPIKNLSYLEYLPNLFICGDSFGNQLGVINSFESARSLFTHISDRNA